MSKVKYVKYRCQNDDCSAEDTYKLFPGESAPPVLNCWKCHAGMSYKPDQLSEQLFARAGMLPVPADELAPGRSASTK